MINPAKIVIEGSKKTIDFSLKYSKHMLGI